MSDGAWITGGQVLSAIGTLVGTRLLTEVLPPEVFGSIALVVGGSALLLACTAGPLLQATLRLYPDFAKKEQISSLETAARRTTWTTVRRATLAVFLGGMFVVGVTRIPLWSIVALLLLLAVDVYRSIGTTLLNAAGRQKTYSLWLTADTFIRPFIAFASVQLFGPSEVAALSGYIAASLFIAAGFSRHIPHISVLGASSEHAKAATADLWRYALPLVPIGLIGWLNGLADRYIIGALIGLDQAGIYAAVYGIISRPFLLLGSSVTATLRQPYYEAIANGNHARERKIFGLWRIIVMGTGLAGVMVVTLWHGWIAKLLLGEAYHRGASLMPWIALGYGLLITAHVFEQACYARHRTKTLLGINTVSGIITLAITTIAVLRFGLEGAAIAVTVYFGCHLIMTYLAARYCRECVL